MGQGIRTPGRPRLPVYPDGSYVGALGTGWGIYAVVVGVGGGVAMVVWFAAQDLGFAVAALGGILLSWPVRRAYQWLPTAQQVTVLVDPDDVVRVVMGRGAVRPSAHRLDSGPDSDRRGFVAGALVVLVGIPAFTASAFLLDALVGSPVPIMALPAAGIWLLVELVLRLVLTNRRLADGWRLGRDGLAGYVVVWQHVNGSSWRHGIGADELLDVVAQHRDLVRTATGIVRPVAEVMTPGQG